MGHLPRNRPNQNLPLESLAQTFLVQASQQREFIASHVRGGLLEAQETIHKRSLHYQSDPLDLPIFSMMHPAQATLEGISCTGGSGTGKTLVLNQMKRSRLALVGEGLRHRVLIYDYHGNERQYLGTLNLKCPVHYLNPLGTGGIGIDIAHEATGPLEAKELAAALISPRDGMPSGGDNQVFLLGAVAVLTEIIRDLQIRAPLVWRLTDVFHIAQDKDLREHSLSRTHRGRALLKGTLGAEKQAAGIMLSLEAYCDALMPLASALNHSTNITFEEWVSGPESVLVFENAHEFQTVLSPFFRWCFNSIQKKVFARKNLGDRYSFFIDEATEAPFLDDLIVIATKGRQHKCELYLGWQDVQGAEKVLGKEGFGALISCCSTQIFFQNNNPQSAQFASMRFGEETVIQGEVSMNFGQNISTNAPNMTPEQRRDTTEYELRTAESTWSHQAYRRAPSPLQNDYLEDFELNRKNHQTARERQLFDQYGILPGSSAVNESHTNDKGTSISFRQVDRQLVTSGEVMYLRKAAVRDGELEAEAYIASTYLGYWKETCWGLQHVSISRYETIPCFEKRLDRQLEFRGWTRADKRRLGIVPQKFSVKTHGRHVPVQYLD